MPDSAVIRWSSGDVSIVIDMTELVEIANQMPERAEKIVRQVAFRAEQEMKQRVPPRVDTGAMMEGIFVDMVDSFTALVGPVVDYAIYHEFGTYKMAAHPFVIPGAEAATRDLDRLIAELFE